MERCQSLSLIKEIILSALGHREREVTTALLHESITSLMVELGETVYQYYVGLSKRKRQESKKGWHEDHSKVPKRDLYYKERSVHQKIIPRVRIRCSVLVRNR